MGVDDDIKQFEEWAENLGCSSNILPPKKTLSRYDKHDMILLKFCRHILILF